METVTLDRPARVERRAALVAEWAQGAIGEPATPQFRLAPADWDDLRADVAQPIAAATIVAARVNDPDIAARPDYRTYEERALDTLLAADPGAVSRAHRTLVVTGAMRLAPLDGSPLPPSTDPLDGKRDDVAKHFLDWTVAHGIL